MRTAFGTALAGRRSSGSESVIWGLWRRRSPIVRRVAGIGALPGETAERRSDGVRRYLDQPYCIAGKLIQLPLVFTSFATSILTAHRRLLMITSYLSSRRGFMTPVSDQLSSALSVGGLAT